MKVNSEGIDDRDDRDLPDTDEEFVKVRRDSMDYDERGRQRWGWTWTGDPLLAVFDTARDAKADADRHHDQKLDWWEEEKNYWMAMRPIVRMPESLRDEDDDCDSECAPYSYGSPKPASASDDCDGAAA